MSAPTIRQGGMGVSVSGWRLARAVARLGQIGTLSSTGIHEVMCRVLQDGDPDGHYRRALAAFPLPDISESILATYFCPEGKAPGAPYRHPQKPNLHPLPEWVDLVIAANFAEVWLAKEGHSGIVGVNCLEKVQIPLVYSFFGAMLAGADFLVIGAGIPNQVANVLNLLAEGQPATYRISLEDAEAGESAEVTFDPRAYCGAAWDSLTIRRPDFLPIVSSPVLAEMLLRKAPENGIQGFVVEHHTAGGHNAPPRGWKGGEVNYGPRDEPDMAKLRALGVPFWLAGSYGSPERLQEALSEGASGIQVGTAFAYCAESGYRSDLKKAVLELALADTLTIETSGKASPTGFPFKIPQIDGTLSDPKIYDRRPRRCGPGLLRVPYQKANGSVGYRCAAEPEAAFEAKGGSPEETEGRVCLCEALFAAAGLPQEKIGGGTEPPLLTCGEDFGFVSAIMGNTYREYTAADVVRYLLGANSHA